MEEKILKSFIKYMGNEVKGLDLSISLSPDTFPDDYGIYSCEVYEKKSNGKAWDVTCTRNGNVKKVIEL